MLLIRKLALAGIGITALGGCASARMDASTRMAGLVPAPASACRLDRGEIVINGGCYSSGYGATTTADAPATADVSSHSTRVPLQVLPNGGQVVAASVNGSPPIKFLLDSGADTVVLPFKLARALLQRGLLNNNEFAGLGEAGLAGGSTMQTIQLRLHSLNLGGVESHDVECLVVAGGEPPLGQSVLSKFGSVTIDYKAHVLILD